MHELGSLQLTVTGVNLGFLLPLRIAKGLWTPIEAARMDTLYPGVYDTFFHVAEQELRGKVFKDWWGRQGSVELCCPESKSNAILTSKNPQV